MSRLRRSLLSLSPRQLLAQSPQRGGALPAAAAALPAGQLVERRRQRGAGRSEQRAFIAFVGATRGMHPDFGGDSGDPVAPIYGMPYIVVAGTQPLVPVTFDYDDESDVGAPGRPPGYPIPEEAKTQQKWIEGGLAGQRSERRRRPAHADRRPRQPHPLRAVRAALERRRTWEAGSGAIFPLDSNARRPDGWTSADAAGLAILPGLVRYDEVFGTDPIRHAFRVTVRTTNGYVFPASHRAGSTTRRAADGRAPAPEGERRHLRLPEPLRSRSSRR